MSEILFWFFCEWCDYMFGMVCYVLGWFDDCNIFLFDFIVELSLLYMVFDDVGFCVIILYEV